MHFFYFSFESQNYKGNTDYFGMTVPIKVQMTKIYIPVSSL